MQTVTRWIVALTVLGTWTLVRGENPPARPMVLYGAVIVDGHVPDQSLTVELSVDGQPLRTQTTTLEGRAWYRVVLPPRPSSPITFAAVGQYNLGSMAPVTWQEGASQRVDLVGGAAVLPAPSIAAAAAAIDNDQWTLTCSFNADLGDTAAENVTFLVEWYLQRVVPIPPAETLPDPVLLKQDTRPAAATAGKAVDSSVTAQQSIDDITDYVLHVIVTPRVVGDRVGPAAWRLVAPNRVAGNI